jgi:pimeloyl-ACP methyl ester carboxylesterase
MIFGARHASRIGLTIGDPVKTQLNPTRALLIVVALLLLPPSRLRAAGSPEPQTFDSNGVKIQYTVEGTGDPVVLIHGLYSSAQMNWRLPGTIKALIDSHQVIALDLRGHGHSGKPEKESDYGIEMVNDVVRLMDHLKVEKARIVGYSMGGIIAMKLAVDHPERVKSIVLGGMGWLKEGGVLADVWERLPGDRLGGQTPPACLHSMGKLGVSEDAVKAIKLPVAILIGDRDPVRRLYVAPLEKVRPDWPVVVISGAGHLNCIAKPQFQEELKKQLAK